MTSKRELLEKHIESKGWKICPNWNGHPDQIASDTWATVYIPETEIVVFKFSRFVGHKYEIHPNPAYLAEATEAIKLIGAERGLNLTDSDYLTLQHYPPMGPERAGIPGSSLLYLAVGILIAIGFLFMNAQ